MMALAEAASVVSTLKSAAEVVDKIRSADTKEEIRGAASALAEMLISARIAALDLIEQKAMLVDERATLYERVRYLEAEIKRVTDFDLSSQKYERVQTARGRFIFRERAAPGVAEPRPYLCPTCFSEKKICILQIWDPEDQQYYCQTCKNNLYI